MFREKFWRSVEVLLRGLERSFVKLLGSFESAQIECVSLA